MRDKCFTAVFVLGVLLVGALSVGAESEGKCPDCLSLKSDLTMDCHVDQADFARMAAGWMKPIGELVVNGDFENPVVDPLLYPIYHTSAGNIPGWTSDFGRFNWVENRLEEAFGGLYDSQMVLVGDVGAQISQTLPVPVAAGATYTISADLISSSVYSNWVFVEWEIRLETSDGEVIARMNQQTHGAPPANSLAYPVSQDGTIGEAGVDERVGKAMKVVIYCPESEYLITVDNVRVESPDLEYVEYSMLDLAQMAQYWLQGSVGDTENLVINSERQLFVDDYLIESLQDATLKLHVPRPAETAVAYENPWEGRYAIYTTVFQDAELYRMYYRGYSDQGQVTCYAESVNGINWFKPNLGLYEFDGSTDNNIILTEEPFTHNFAPFLDTRDGVPDAQRYKSLAGSGSSGLVPFISADGILWSKLQTTPVITAGAFDSQNVSFWSESEQCYVCYFRSWVGGYRRVSRSTSANFVNWTTPVLMGYDTEPTEHIYVNQTSPYFRAKQIYIALGARFMSGRQALTAQQCSDLNIGSTGGGCASISGGVLMSTRGEDLYHRKFMETFVRPGPGYANWIARTNYPACGVVETGPGEMSFYVQREYGLTSGYLQRMTMRFDGFASVNAPYGGGEMLTRALKFYGDKLEINYATSEFGSIWVEIQNPDGSVIPGYSQGNCDEIIGDEIARVVTWGGSSDLSSLACVPLRLRFVMKDADLYSLKFQLE